MAKIMELRGYPAEAALESAGRLPISGPFADMLASPARMLRRWREAGRHRRAMRELSQLDDRMLRDIGVNRGEIPRVALFGREIF